MYQDKYEELISEVRVLHPNLTMDELAQKYFNVSKSGIYKFINDKKDAKLSRTLEYINIFESILQKKINKLWFFDGIGNKYLEIPSREIDIKGHKDYDPNALSIKLVELLQENNFSAEQFSNLIDIDYNDLRKICMGEQYPTYQQFLKICDAAQIAPTEFLTGKRYIQIEVPTTFK